ncbi:MAG TPA: 1,2-phenylacetyl-CoA epoxidase subunit PaaD [Anaerolineales bacterium]|nr:1,2-phenylacetyl-CoA epoxidase subunit PaaD [Anaerolineales bacterium]
MGNLTTDTIWQILDLVKDPEIPVVSVVEMGLIRSVGLDGETVIITMTPTFAGCPALQVMQREITNRLHQGGVREVRVQITFSPPWSTDWITPLARQKLKDFGLAPPPRHAGRIDLALSTAVACPYCNSENTSLKNDFGPTLCRAIYVCNNCQQPFEYFKPL